MTRDKSGTYKSKKVYFIFVGLEMALDKILRETMAWVIRNFGVEEWFVHIVMNMYNESRTFARVNGVLNEDYSEGECTPVVNLELTPVHCVT